MRKSLLVIVALLLGIMAMYAKPVDVATAQRLGQGFVQNKAMFAKTATNQLNLVFTFRSNNGVATAYVFNLAEGFVIVSADDCYHPIIGYSYEGHFDYDTAPDGMRYMLNELSNDIARCVHENIIATSKVACEWKNLERSGQLHPEKSLPVVDVLVQQRWDQGSPYNMYVPNGYPTGCVATAMAQLMKYWEWPVTGTGNHSYQWNGQTLSADFGATTYDWDNMVDSYSSGTITPEQKEAVATLMWHCGVSVDMNYESDGSGAFSVDVPIAINQYFSYSDHSTHISRIGFYDDWIALLKSNIDQYIPIYYSGHSEEGGHAFICDGYDTDGLFHFNWGWGGSSNGFLLIDGENFDYTGGQAIVYDFIPDYIYDGMPQTVTDLSVSIDSDVSRIGHLTWTNPTTTMSGSELTTIDKVIIKRNDVPVQEITGTAPGQTVTCDDEVPFFDQFEYTVHVVANDNYGRTAKTKAVFGPYCDWKVIMTSSDFHGWNGGGITVQNAAGSYIDFLTTTQSTASMQTFQMALGNNNLYWVEPNSIINNLSFKVKDASNQLVYEYSGPSTGLEAGLIKTLNNSCGYENVCEAPYNLKATLDPEDDQTVILTWESDHDPEFGYCIYRDGFLFNMAHETQYKDEHTNIGGHCYYVTALCNGGETANSNEYCITSGTGCDEPMDLYFDYVGNRVQLTWSAPENTTPKGYVVYRKTEGTNFKEIKRLRQTTYKDTSAQQGVVYQYAVVAYYDENNCFSTYANSLFDEGKFYVEVNWANDQYYNTNPQLIAKVDEEAMSVTLYWEPIYQVLDNNYTVSRNGVVISNSVTDVSYVDNEDLVQGGTYTYKVTAFAPEGDSGLSYEFTTNEVTVVFEADPLPCPAPFDFKRLLEPVNTVHLSWSHNYEERIPDHFIVSVMDHLTGDSIEVTVPGITNEYYQEDIDPNGMDKSYRVKAVYEDCESEYGLTEEGEDFIRFSNVSVNENPISNVKLYPNPTTGLLSVEAEEMTSVSVFDLVGQCLIQMSAEDGQAVLDMSQLQSGIYFVKVSTANGSMVQRIVKM